VLIVSDEKPGSKSLAEAFKKGNLAKKFSEAAPKQNKAKVEKTKEELAEL
jgi:hypothetical protein